MQMWVIFGLTLFAAIAIDLVVFHREARRITFGQALAETGAWIALALLFNLWVYFARGHQAGLEFLTKLFGRKIAEHRQYFCFCGDISRA